MEHESMRKQIEDEVVDLHVVLQAWFRGEGNNNPDLVMNHFDRHYKMIGAAGKALSRDVFASLLPNLWGSRPELVMKIEDVQICQIFEDGIVGTYKEIQSEGPKATERWSSVVFVMEDKKLKWKFLQETFCS